MSSNMGGGFPGAGGYGSTGGTENDVKDDRSYIQEIRGTLFSLNDYLSKAQSHYRFEGLKGRPKDRVQFKEFYMYMYKLTTDSRELVEENNPHLLEYLDKWLTGMNWIVSNENVNSEALWKWFTIGEKLAIQLQKTLYKLGIKDSNVSQRVGFPFALVQRMVEIQQEEKAKEKEAKQKAREKERLEAREATA